MLFTNGGYDSWRRLTPAETDAWLSGEPLANSYAVPASPQPTINDPAERQRLIDSGFHVYQRTQRPLSERFVRILNEQPLRYEANS